MRKACTDLSSDGTYLNGGLVRIKPRMIIPKLSIDRATPAVKPRTTLGLAIFDSIIGSPSDFAEHGIFVTVQASRRSERS
jgi:hypothetical protein